MNFLQRCRGFEMLISIQFKSNGPLDELWAVQSKLILMECISNEMEDAFFNLIQLEVLQRLKNTHIKV